MSTAGGVDRPLGVAILAVLDIIAGILAALVGLLSVIAGGFLWAYLETFIGPPGAIGGFLGAIVTAIGVVILVIGAISIVLGWALWGGKEWARILSIILSVIGMLFGLLVLFVAIGAGGLFGIVIIAVHVIVIYYLTRPSVKAFFAQQVARPAPAGPPI
ncbi:MAG: hypothetical protein OEW84_07210 [Aigarchaeota archaeon]|nr:hypothetical protein [Aigarchaeota archaeon]